MSDYTYSDYSEDIAAYLSQKFPEIPPHEITEATMTITSKTIALLMDERNRWNMEWHKIINEQYVRKPPIYYRKDESNQ